MIKFINKEISSKLLETDHLPCQKKTYFSAWYKHRVKHTKQKIAQQIYNCKINIFATYMHLDRFYLFSNCQAQKRNFIHKLLTNFIYLTNHRYLVVMRSPEMRCWRAHELYEWMRSRAWYEKAAKKNKIRARDREETNKSRIKNRFTKNSIYAHTLIDVRPKMCVSLFLHEPKLLLILERDQSQHKIKNMWLAMIFFNISRHVIVLKCIYS